MHKGTQAKTLVPKSGIIAILVVGAILLSVVIVWGLWPNAPTPIPTAGTSEVASSGIHELPTIWAEPIETNPSSMALKQECLPPGTRFVRLSSTGKVYLMADGPEGSEKVIYDPSTNNDLVLKYHHANCFGGQSLTGKREPMRVLYCYTKFDK